MWRYYFYNKSSVGRYIYKPLVGIAWILFLIFAAISHVVNKEPQLFGLLFLIAGFILFFIAKISVIRKGKLITFGVSAVEHMSSSMAACYYLGYTIMIFGFIMSFR